MKRLTTWIKIPIKLLLFTCGFVLILMVLSTVLKPKWMFQTREKSPETETWSEFYEEPKNSLDILFIGSSHVYDDVNPVVIYENTGLKGFDLASSRQDMATSYFYIKEALRRQNPQYIVLETYGFGYDALSAEEQACYKRSLDYMRGLSVKIEAYRAWHKNLPDESLFPRIFTIMDYHSRWDSLEEIDFTFKEKIETVNGYSPVYSCQTIAHEKYYEEEEVTAFSETTMEYFEKICDICKEENIQLVLFSAPADNARKVQADQFRAIADLYQVPYYDFNEDTYYSQIGLDSTKDYRDYSHLNVYGSEKFSRFLAEQMVAWFSLGDTMAPNDVWEQKAEQWTAERTEGILSNIVDLKEYLDYVNNDDFIVMVNTEGEFTKKLDDEVLDAFETLGCKKIRTAGKKASYLAVVQNGNCRFEDKRGDKNLKYETVIDGNSIRLYSAGVYTGNDSYCIFNDQEVSVSKTGINIEVYSVSQGKIIDAVNFNVSAGAEAYR